MLQVIHAVGADYDIYHMLHGVPRQVRSQFMCTLAKLFHHIELDKYQI